MLRLHLNIVFQGRVFNDLITCQTCLCEMSCRAFSSLSLTICVAKNKAPFSINYAGIEKNHRHPFGTFVVQEEFLFLPQKHRKALSLCFFSCMFSSQYVIMYLYNWSDIFSLSLSFFQFPEFFQTHDYKNIQCMFLQCNYIHYITKYKIFQ